MKHIINVMSHILMLLINLTYYSRWTTCAHRNKRPVSWSDWQCQDCGVYL